MTHLSHIVFNILTFIDQIIRLTSSVIEIKYLVFHFQSFFFFVFKYMLDCACELNKLVGFLSCDSKQKQRCQKRYIFFLMQKFAFISHFKFRFFFFC